MTVRILTPTETCCEPEALALNTRQPNETCAKGVEWRAVEAIDEGRGNHLPFVKWSRAVLEGQVIA